MKEFKSRQIYLDLPMCIDIVCVGEFEGLCIRSQEVETISFEPEYVTSNFKLAIESPKLKILDLSYFYGSGDITLLKCDPTIIDNDDDEISHTILKL
jgi:hypothetical protein